MMLKTAGALGWVGACLVSGTAPHTLSWWNPHWAFWLGVFGGVNLLLLLRPAPTHRR